MILIKIGALNIPMKPVVSYTACGPHDVTLVVTGGGQTNTKLRSNYISVTPYINIVAIPQDTVCSPAKITLNGTILDGASYLWSPGGATTAMITLDPLVIGLGSHTYTLVATSIDGCSNSDTATIVFQECTGVKEQTDNLTVLAYPNPVHGSFTMELTTKKGESAEVKIISPLGNTVYSQNFMSSTGKIVKEISMASVSPGIYLLVLQSGGQKTTLKLFVN